MQPVLLLLNAYLTIAHTVASHPGKARSYSDLDRAERAALLRDAGLHAFLAGRAARSAETSQAAEAGQPAQASQPARVIEISVAELLKSGSEPLSPHPP